MRSFPFLFHKISPAEQSSRGKYKIILKNEENFEEIDGFFEQFRKKNIDRVFIPKDEVELMKCLERVL